MRVPQRIFAPATIRPTPRVTALLATSLLGTLIFAQALAAGAAERLTLRSAVVTREEVVSLSDLLPPGAPEETRARAQAISLGTAPLPGAHRTFDRTLVLRALRANPALRRSLEIPPVIDVTRWSRLLTRTEVLSAIQKTVRDNQLTGADSLTAEDVAFGSAIAVTEDAPQLKVTRIEPAPNGAGTRLRLWLPSESRLPPFWVRLDREIDQITPVATKDLPSKSPVRDMDIRMERRPATVDVSRQPAQAAGPAGRSPRREIRAGETLRTGLLDPLVLVKAGKPVQLVFRGSGMRITTTGIPLDLGREGEKIRVRAILTGKILLGTVVAAQTVEVGY